MSSQLDFRELDIEGLQLIIRKPLRDERGCFERLYCQESMTVLGLDKPLSQINRSHSRNRGTVRGMHFQRPPHAEVKIISCQRGEVFDVAVDLREGSPTYMCWHGELLTADNSKSLYIPEGFAHGFQTLTDGCELLYLHSAAYAPHAEDGINPLEPRLQIDWPLPIMEISERDRGRAWLDESFTGVEV